MADVIPYLDLAAQYRGIKSEIRAAMDRVLDTNAYILGPEVKAFEEAFAAAHDVRHAVAVNSGTSALHLALLALGVGPGDEVITTPFTFIATVAAIGYTGATPVFVDIDPESFTLDPSKIEAAITPKTKVIMPVHLYGQPADMDPILAVAERHGLHVVEDAAQAHLAEYKGRKVGSFGAIACFSFYPGKNLGAYGEGGAAVTNDDRYAATMRALRDWGQTERYRHAMKGYNYRMDGLQGAVLGVKMPHLDAWTEGRRRVAAAYREQFEPAGVALPKEMPYARHVYHVYAIRVADRAAAQRALQEAGIQTGIHYPIPVHLQEAWAELGYRRGDFPHAEQAADEVLSLPIYAELTDEQVARVASAVVAHTTPVRPGQVRADG
ncbi:MAG: DegT/DnrJ/EryC1/StrS family aminotransferase [Acidobacteriota bacterium]